ncbi:MAG: prenyltransferase/squalene oxidase repeat-containing protein [Planctomycetota bacterium]
MSKPRIPSPGAPAQGAHHDRAAKRRRIWVCAALLAVGSLAPSAAATPAQRGQERDEATSYVPITEAHEAAVNRGLEWLSQHQLPDGGWKGEVGFKLNSTYRVTRDGETHVGVTALAGMAFLAGGHLPGRGQYGATLDRCINFVLSCVQEDGYITHAGTRMYSHAFATLFLAEVYGLTHREDVRPKLQNAIDFIVKSQNDEGGWRYVPLARESDMSIVVCQSLALRAARNIGIRVPKSTVDRAIAYVVASAVTDDPRQQRMRMGYRSDVGTFRYQIEDNSRSNFPLTAAGVTALHGLGIYSHDLIVKGIDFLNAEMPAFNANHGERQHYFFWYGHYYGVQAMYSRGGHDWVNYFTRLREFLLRKQDPDGSWENPVGPGEAFGTAMAVLILEIPFNFLPIFHR